MKACVLHEIGDLRCETIHRPTLNADSVLIRVAACGVCGSDMPRIFTKGAYRFPIVPGHEFAGTVEATGTLVNKSLLGARAAVFPLIPCRRCEACEIGAYAQCSDYDYLGSRCDGAFAEFVAAPAANLLLLPDKVSFEEGAMVEPAAVAAHAIRSGGVKTGDAVVVFGAGPIGLLAAQWARLHGAHSVTLVDIDDEKSAYAAPLGFAAPCNPSREDVVERVRAITERGADVVIEATGSPAALEQAVQCARTFGIVVLLGNPSGPMTLSQNAYWTVLRRELRLVGSWNSAYARLPRNEWALALSYMAKGDLDAASLISHRPSLEALPELLEQVRTGAVKPMKIMALPA